MEEKEEMAKVFVVGHRNPDTDSICSAIAYADIKNRTSQKVKYIPKRAGQINEETEYVLNRFGMLPPGYMSRNMLPAGQDVSMRRQNMCLTILAYRSQSWLRM